MKTTAKRLLQYITLVLISVTYLASSVDAQTPDLINYQTVVRDAQGQVIANQSVSIRLSVLSGSSSGTQVFSEEHILTTNDFGLVNLMLGNGSNQSGSLGAIDWSVTSYFLSTELDITAGSSYSFMGVSQLLSVPYALHAKTVEMDNVDDADADPTNEIQILSIMGDTLMLSSGGEVDLGYLNNAASLAALEQKHGLDSAYLYSLITANSLGITMLSNKLDADSAALAQMINTHISEDHDTSATNEIQVLSFSNDTMYLSNGGAVYLGGYDNQTSINALATELDQDSAAFSTALNNHISIDMDTSAANELQAISISNDTLYLSDGGMVYLGGYDNQSAINALSTELDQDSAAFATSLGNHISADNDTSAMNEIQTLTLSGTTLGITSGNTVDLSAVQDGTGTDDQNLTFSGTTLSIEGGNSVNLSSLQDGTGTDDQNLTLSGNTLSIESGNSVSLAGYLDNTDAQNLSSTSSGNNRTINISGGTGTTINVADNDNSTTNEIQSLSLSGTTLSISSGNNVNLSSLQDGTGTDDQNLTLSGTTLSIESGNSVNLSSLQDGTGTDDQTLNFSNDTLYIEDGNSVYLGLSGGGGDSDWDSTGSNIYRVTGNVGIGTSAPGAKLDVAGHIAQTGTGQSVFLGEGAGNADDLTNNRNVFIGYRSGYITSSGSNNSAMGYYSLNSNTSGQRNIAIGDVSMQSNTTGSFNSSVGVYSLQLNTTGNRNSAFGITSLQQNTQGQDNVAVGANALQENTTGNYNTAIGSLSLLYNKAGSHGTAIGSYAMHFSNNSTISFTNYNVAVGYEALRGSTNAASNTGNFNSVVGYGSMRVNTTGQRNSTLGWRTLQLNTTGSQNTAIGYGGLYNNTTGTGNTGVGNGALFGNTTGNYNVGIGQGTFDQNSTGSYNTAVGVSAGQSATGSRNVFLGFSAGLNESGSDKLYIENSNSSTPLIYGDFVSDLVRINGTLDINNAYSLPTADGTSGQVLTTDGSGGVSWQSTSAGTSEPVIRWATFSTYSQAFGWYAGNHVDMFGGVNPSNWSDNNAIAANMSSDKQVLRTLFNKKAYVGNNAVINAEEWYSYSSTNGRFSCALLRIENTTSSAIVWNAQWWCTAFAVWSERASVAINGVDVWNSGSANFGATAHQSTAITIPPNRVSTVIFISASSPQNGTRSTYLAFDQNCLNLPTGLQLVDDLHTAPNGWEY